MVNADVVVIEEILGRAKQGKTEPFLCRGEDGNLYYVKGKNAGRRGQVAEWLGSSLALFFGLPVAPCVIVEVAPELIAISPSEWQELGHGLAFGSLAIRSTMEVNVANIERVPIQTRQDLLVFDWWIRNEDRTLTEHGGNPNLLWNTEHEKIVVIDHNLAFDAHFNARDFLACHIFREEWNSVTQDWIMRADYADRMKRCLVELETIWDRMPDEWSWLGEGVPLAFDLNAAAQILNMCNTKELWELEQ